MFTKDVVVKNEIGLHSKPASMFIDMANDFESTIWVEQSERRVNGKSLLGVLSLGIIGGQVIKIIAKGCDEKVAVEQLARLVESNFEEET